MPSKHESNLEISPEKEAKIKRREIDLLQKEELFLKKRLQYTASVLTEMQKVSSKDKYEEEQALQQMKRDFQNQNMSQKSTIKRLEKEQVSQETEMKDLEQMIAETTASVAQAKQEIKDIEAQVAVNRKAIKEMEKEITSEEHQQERVIDRRRKEADKRRESDEKVIKEYKKEEAQLVKHIQKRVAILSALKNEA